MELLVIDRLLYKFFGVIDNFFEWLTAPRCKCKKKEKMRDTKSIESFLKENYRKIKLK
jgi:hypothetical protein